MISQSPQIDIYVLMNYIYPLNSIYITTENITEAQMSSRFGGLWTKIKDRFLLASGDTYTSGNTGGEASHTLTTSEMPSHTHTFTGSAGTTGNTAPTFSGNSMSGSIDKIAGLTYTSSGVLSVSDSSDTYGRGGTYSTAMKKLNFSGTPSGTVSSHSHSFTPSGTNSSTGSGLAHNTMPPYLVVNVFKRTALYSA